MISRLRYTLREMWASLSRNLTLTVAAVITSTISLLLFGMTLLIQQAFDNQLSQWTGGVKMIVYVKNGAPDDAVSTIQEALESRPEIIKNVTYCPIDCSFSQAKKLFAADPESLKFLSEENIPSYFSVEPVDKQSIDQLLSIRQSFVALPGVLRADFPSDQITVLGKLKSFFGVRTSKDLERDVGELNPLHVVIAGVIVAALFVVALIVLVNWVIGSGVAARP
jgi:cell division protein FtsX